MGPVWTVAPRDDGRLVSARRESMRLAAAKGARSIAFPSIRRAGQSAADVAVVRFVLLDGGTSPYRRALEDLRRIT